MRRIETSPRANWQEKVETAGLVWHSGEQVYWDESACYEFLVGLLHPGGLACPHCSDRDHLKVHRRDRAPILAYRCTACRRISSLKENQFGQVVSRSYRRPSISSTHIAWRGRTTGCTATPHSAARAVNKIVALSQLKRPASKMCVNSVAWAS